MMNVLAQPPQAKVIGSRALSSSVSGKAGFGMNEAVRLSGRPRSKSQGISSSGLYTSPSSPGRNVVSRDSLYSRSVSSNYVPSQPGNLTTRLPTDVHNYISTALRSHHYIESGEDCITQKAQVSSSTPSTDRADHQRQTPHRTERKSSGGIDSAQASSFPERPTTPSALPRPSFRFSNSGNSSRPVTPARSRSSTGSYARPTSRQGEWIDLSRSAQSPIAGGRSVSGPLHKSTNIPPVPAMPSQQEIHEKEAFWAAYARSSLHTPPPTSWGTKAGPASPHAASRSVSTPTPQQRSSQRASSRQASYTSGALLGRS
jgi:hypothetical protein